jgi:hypothetical protein
VDHPHHLRRVGHERGHLAELFGEVFGDRHSAPVS